MSPKIGGAKYLLGLLLLSVLPMLENLSSLHAQLLLSNSGGKGKHRKGKNQDRRMQQLYYPSLLVGLEPPPEQTAGAVFDGISEAEIDEFIKNNRIDPSQSVAAHRDVDKQYGACNISG